MIAWAIKTGTADFHAHGVIGEPGHLAGVFHYRRHLLETSKPAPRDPPARIGSRSRVASNSGIGDGQCKGSSLLSCIDGSL